MHVDERIVAGDGFMINFVSVMQHLASKVRLDRVDPFYFHRPDSRLGQVATDETRLRMTKQELEEWLREGDAGKEEGDPKRPAANFHTECWFLTLQAHHLSVLPCIRRYQRRLRALRELQKATDELERTQVLKIGAPHGRKP